jgi:hypothetical protein
VKRDLEEYKEYAAVLVHASKIREADYIGYLSATAAGNVPMGFMGRAHSKPAIAALQPHMHMHVLMPAATSTEKDPGPAHVVPRWPQMVIDAIAQQERELQ